MELDEFKDHWNAIHDKEFQQQIISTQKIEQIIMNTTGTLDKLKEKSIHWNKVNIELSKAAIGIYLVVLLIALIKVFYYQNKENNIIAIIVFIILLIVSTRFSKLMFKKQEQILSIFNAGNVYETLKKTITEFKRFYLKISIISLFFNFLMFFVLIKLNMFHWNPSLQTTIIICGLMTVVSFLVCHWYYEIKFLKTLRSLEANFKYLEGNQSDNQI